MTKLLRILLPIAMIVVLTGCGKNGDLERPVIMSSQSGDKTAVITWNPVKEATHYKVYIARQKDPANPSSQNTTNFQLLGSTDASVYTDAGLNNRDYYFYRVQAVNNSQESALSDPVRVYPIATGGDTTKPSYSDLQIPAKVTAGQLFSVSVNLVDDIAGVYWGGTMVGSPNGTSPVSIRLVPDIVGSTIYVDGKLTQNPVSKKWEAEMTISVVAPKGTWKVKQLLLMDKIGNYEYVYDPGITFEVR